MIGHSSFLDSNIAHLCRQHGIQPLNLPALLGLVGPAYAWELHGQRVASPAALIALADYFSISVDRLIRMDMEGISRQVAGKDIQLILFDVDGTLTDGGMYYGEKGEQMKKFDVKDGIMISRLAKRRGVQFGLVSATSYGQILNDRAADLGIQRVYAGKQPKTEVVSAWLETLGIGFDQVAYVGDDLNDLPMIRAAGISACPSDACRQVKEAVHFVLSRPGGKGCIREFLEDILNLPSE